VADDTLQTHTVDPLEARVVVFRQQPDARGFAELRQELRDAGRGELLADVCATWAPHERDPIRAADAWSEAGEAMVVLGEAETAIEYLQMAIDLDPTNDRATDRLLEIVEPGDPALAAEIIEHELAELAQLFDPARKRAGADGRRKAEVVQRRAAQHRRAAELWDRLGRVDRALWHFQQAWKLEPHRTEALEAARQLYHSLGDDAMFAKLFGAELEVLGSDRSAAATARKACVRLELGKLALRAKDLEAAAGHLEEALKLDPTSLDIAEKLAEVYATPGFRAADAPQTEASCSSSRPPPRHARRRPASATSRRRHRPYYSGAKASEALSGLAVGELDRILRHRSDAGDPGARRHLASHRAHPTA
jgi:tetratricopeptide (TPR) repeat protein